MAYSQDDISQFDVAGEDFPLWLLIALTLFGVVGSILTMHLLISSDSGMSFPDQAKHESFAQNQSETNQLLPEQAEEKTPLKALVGQVQDKPQQAATLIAEEELSDAGLKVSPDLGVVESSDLPETSQIPSQAIAEQKSAELSLQSDTSQQQNDIITATAESSAEKSLPKISHQSVLQQPIKGLQGGEVASEPGDCPPIISFSFAKEAINPRLQNSEEKIKQVKDWLQDHPQDTLMIAGHASSRGAEEYNLLLSYRRARAVTLLLVKAGIAKNRLKTRAYGEYLPVQGLPSASEINRRVSLHIETTGNCLIEEDTNQ